MKGSRFIHAISDKTDSLSSQEIVELRDSEGIPVWFSRDIFKTVCLTGECRMVRLRLLWKGNGDFLGMQIPENAPLTKTDHSEFKPEDYQKLYSILADSLSILKSLKLTDLTVEKKDEQSINQVDAISGATQPFIYEYVVRNAVYTCYTLWHTVYGPTRTNIMAILENRANKDYLQKLFVRNYPQYLIWAIDFINRHPEYHSEFYTEILNLIKSEDANLSRKAIGYFTPDRMLDKNIQIALARITGEASPQSKFEIIWKFSALPKVSNDALLILLEHYEKRQINASLLGYVCKLIQFDNLQDSRIIQKLKKLSKDKNPYVRNLITEK